MCKIVNITIILLKKGLINNLVEYEVEGNIYRICDNKLNAILGDWAAISNKTLMEMSGHEFSYPDKYIDEKNS